MADVISLHGGPLPAPDTPQEATDLVTYFRNLADLIERGEAVITGAVVLIPVGAEVTMHRVNLSPLEAVGLCTVGTRLAAGG